MITTSKISHFFLQLYIIKSYNFHPASAFNYEFHTLSHPTIFLQLAEDPRSVFPSLRGLKKIFNLSPSFSWLTSDCRFVPLINIRNKTIKAWTHPMFPPLNKTRNFPRSHFTTLLPFPPSHLTNLSPTFYFPETMQHNFVLELHTHFLE